jgi:hypothetical protein
MQVWRMTLLKNRTFVPPHRSIPQQTLNYFISRELSERRKLPGENLAPAKGSNLAAPSQARACQG